MEIRIRHRFDGARRERVEALYLLDDEFSREAFASAQLERRVIDRKRDGDRFVRVLRLLASDAVPPALRRFVPATGFHIDEHVEYDFSRHRGTWKTVPSIFQAQVHARGTLEIVEVERAIEVRFDGEAVAALPLIGRTAERFALQLAEHSHEVLAEAVRRKLRGEASEEVFPNH